MNTKGIAAGLAVAAAMLPVFAFAQTTDTQSQIQALLAQIKALQQQLMQIVASSTTHGGMGGDWMHSSSTPPGMGGDNGGRKCVNISRTIHQGMQGDDVKEIQQLLSDSGLFQGGITGFFGPLTAHAMAMFQKNNGIATSTDGSVGPRTMEFFAKDCGKGPQGNTGGGPGGGPGGDHGPMGMMGGAVTGTIAANSGSSITITNNGGQSKVVNITASTSIMVFAGTSTAPTMGSISDLTVSKVAAAEGPGNSDGSINAKIIRVGFPMPPQRPDGMGNMMWGQGGVGTSTGDHGPMGPRGFMQTIFGGQGGPGGPNGQQGGGDGHPQNY